MVRPEFVNEAFTDFSIPSNHEAMTQALAQVAAQFDQEYPAIINGEKITVAAKFQSFNPGNTAQAVGTFQKIDRAQTQQAIEIAHATFASWSKVPAAERAEYLFKASEKVRAERFTLSATMVYEVGKSWAEADGDVAEAIDFLEFYAREMLRYAEKQPITPFPGEANEMFYIPLGVGAIIPPWNFPFAILVGMSTAAIVTGNTVVLKPAGDSALIGYQFARIMEEVGLPKGVLNFVTGSGAEVGDEMVRHPLTRFICFTGSKEVGLQINALAAQTMPGQKWIKRVIAEMGGKDGIVVDASADLEAAASGIVAAAFGFQGQKCSACSRAIIHQDVYDEVAAKVVAKTQALTIGEPENPDHFMGPVINAASEAKTLEYIEIGKQEGTLLVGGHKTSDKGYYIAPTVFGDVAPEARISLEEIFAPVLALIKARDFDHALEIANNTEFGLTGAVYSQSEENLQRAREEFFVGNLYLNRKCTGAMVGAHPFGGFNMSGTDSKAGGRDYLLLFMQAKSVARKIG